MQFNGSNIVITGAGSGIGAALAKRAAAAGAQVFICDLDGAKADQIAAQIGAHSMACDVRSETAVQEMIAQAKNALGGIDIYVSNAGLGRGEPSHAASADNDVWMLNWDVHVMAHVYASRALLPDMISRGSGHLVNVASAAGLLSQIGDAAYSATKHAAVSFAESLAIAHGGDGVGVSVVCPQYVATPLLGLSDTDAENRASLLTADDVAAAVQRGVEADAFMILSHPQVQEYVMQRAQDHDRWITGMQMLRAKAKEHFGQVDAQTLYKLV